MKKVKLTFLAFFSPALMGVAVGDKAPDIASKDQDGKLVRLSSYRGRFLLVYFYPKDDTPGCTKEACSLRDQFAQIKALDASVLGVSKQDEKSHQAFKAKHKLPFDLLVDTDGTVSGAFGVGNIPGTDLSKRQSFLIGPDGKILRTYPDVDPAKHSQEIIDDINKAKAQGK